MPSMPFIVAAGIQIKLSGIQTMKKKWHFINKKPFNFCALFLSFHGMDTSDMIMRYWVLQVQERFILWFLIFSLSVWYMKLAVIKEDKQKRSSD